MEDEGKATKLFCELSQKHVRIQKRFHTNFGINVSPLEPRT